MGLSNTGKPGCIPIQSVTSKLIMVPLINEDGYPNRVDTFGMPTNLAGWQNFAYQSEPSFRWFPLPAFENVELPKADSLFEEANSGRMVFLRQGKRSFKGELWGSDSSPVLLSKLQMNRCVAFGVYIVDVYGNLVGLQNRDTDPDRQYLYPIPVDNPSWDPRYEFATDSTTSKIILSFDFDRLVDEGTMMMITPAESGIDFNQLQGMIDARLGLREDGSANNTTLEIYAYMDYGTAATPVPIRGLTLNDFYMYNLTANAVDLPTSVVEVGENGKYIVTNPFNAGSEFSLKITKEGYEGIPYVWIA
jgi:hypothetical protein